MAGRGRKKTIESYRKDVYEKWGDEYVILGDEYVNNKTEIKTLHTPCGKEYFTTPNRLLSGYGCKDCANKKMSETMKSKNIKRDERFKPRTHESFIEDLEKINPNVEILDTYINNETKVKAKCKVCDNEWEVVPNGLLRGNQCPECSKIKRRRFKNKEEVEDYLNSLSNEDRYEVIEFNKVMLKNSKFKHLNCGYEFETLIANVTRKDFSKCPKCNGHQIYNDKSLNEKIMKETDGEYSYVSGYKTQLDKCIIRHNVCGNEFEYSIIGVTNGRRMCPKCSDNILKYTIPQINQKIKEITGDDYEVQDDFQGVNKPCHIKHLKCGRIYTARIGAMIYNNISLCPCTRQQSRSRAEDQVIEYVESIYDGNLMLNNRHVIPPYELDIYLPDINLAIEYNGLYWHSKLTNDKITPKEHQFKIELCMEKGIRLIQIFDKDWNEPNSQEKIKQVLKVLINNPNKYINKDLRWGIPLTEKECVMYEPQKIFLKNSTIVKTEEESNNYTYLCGTYVRKIDLLINKLKELDVPFRQNVNINNMEYDIYFSQQKLVIKIINPYVHNIDRGYKGKEFLDAKELLEKNNHKVLFINTCELDKLDIIVSKIEHALNINKKPKVYARKCHIKEIDTKTKNEFLNKNHIQGKDTACIKLGLYYEDTLVSVLTFCKPRISLGHKKGTSYDYELSRFASNNDYIVVGGFSKLLKYFEANYEWNEIVTYADKRYSQGNLYLKNRFTQKNDSKPSYSYINLNSNSYELHYRFKFRKQQLKNLFPDTYNDNKTEKQIMRENGYVQVFNLGNYVFSLSK